MNLGAAWLGWVLSLGGQGKQWKFGRAPGCCGELSRMWSGLETQQSCMEGGKDRDGMDVGGGRRRFVLWPQLQTIKDGKCPS